MDLDLNLLTRVNPKAESITFWDNTGVGSLFPRGWQNAAGNQNIQNPKKSDAATIYISMVWDDGLTGSHMLTQPEMDMYLDPTQGFTILSSVMLGGNFLNFPDGIVSVDVTITGQGIAGQLPVPWTSHIIRPEAFITFLQNKIRNWVINTPYKIRTLDQVFDQTIANLILDAIYYNTQFFQIDRATRALDFLKNLVDSGKRISDFVSEQNL